MSAVFLDTGILVAALDRDDPHHEEAVALLKSPRRRFVVPAAVLPEVCYLANKYLGAAAERAFIESLVQEELPVDWTEASDLRRASELMAERPELGLVDCLVVAAAERLDARAVATLDRRHFSTVRPRHCRAFELLP